MAVLCGGVGLGVLPCAETPSRASYGLTVACRTYERGSAADDGQTNDAWLSQTVGARQNAQPDSLGPIKSGFVCLKTVASWRRSRGGRFALRRNFFAGLRLDRRVQGE